MRLLVLYIVGGVYEQNNIVKNVNVDDWTAELVIIASTELHVLLRTGDNDNTTLTLL